LRGSLRETLDWDVETDKLKMALRVYFEVFSSVKVKNFLIHVHFLINFNLKIGSYSIQ
jgi:hypothetical protein